MTKLIPGAPIRSEFPIFSTEPVVASGKRYPLAYLDTAASSQKPKCVIERLSHFLSFEYANIHRGAYRLSAEATGAYEHAREELARFIGAPSARNIIFTRGTTESINLVSYSLSRWFKRGDIVLLPLLEHHSNFVPWQILADRTGVKLEFVKISPDATLDMDDLEAKLKVVRPKLLACTHVSNAFGSVVPIADVVGLARDVGCRVLVDAAQSVSHAPLSIAELGCDLLAFSGHKLYGPTGIGVLYANDDMLSVMEPFHGGGNMIESVKVEGTTFAEPPKKFEAGTPPIAEAVALGEVIGFLDRVGMEAIARYEARLFQEAFDLLTKEPDVTVYGPATTGNPHVSILAFNVNGVHPHDVSTVADGLNVQIRAGHHCAMPALAQLGLQSSARASIGMYSTLDDFHALIEAIRQARKIFRS